MTEKRFFIMVLALYIIRSPLMLVDWIIRRINGNATGPNPSRWDKE